MGSQLGTYPRAYIRSLLNKLTRGEPINSEERQILINEGHGIDVSNLERNSRPSGVASPSVPPPVATAPANIVSTPTNSAGVNVPAEPTSVTPTNPLPFEMTINVNKSKEEFKKFGESIADYATISRIKTNGSNQTHQISYQPEHYDKILEEMQKHPTLKSQAILFEKHGVGPVESPQVVPSPEINSTPEKDEADDFF